MSLLEARGTSLEDMRTAVYVRETFRKIHSGG